MSKCRRSLYGARTTTYTASLVAGLECIELAHVAYTSFSHVLSSLQSARSLHIDAVAYGRVCMEVRLESRHDFP